MDVHVDQAGDYDQAGGIDLFRPGAHPLAHLDHPPVAHGEVQPGRPVVGDDQPVAHYEVEGHQAPIAMGDPVGSWSDLTSQYSRKP